MSWTLDNNNMSVHEKTTHIRLYPSLPSSGRYDAFVADPCINGNTPPAALFPADAPLEDKQLEVSAASTEARWKAQILILEEQNQELLSINEKWSKEYRTMRQYYKDKVEDLKASLHRDYTRFEEEVCEGGEMNNRLSEKTKLKTLRDHRSTWTGDAEVNPELLKAKMEAKELQAQNNTLTCRGRQQAEEIRRLNRALEEVLQNTSPVDVSSETLQEVWKHQAEIYKEDFVKERRDRKKLKEKYLDLEKKFRTVHSELHVLKSQVTWTQTPQPIPECTCRPQAKSPNWEVRQINPHHMVLQKR
ncbi:TNFAIP3-interacting protein 3-like [Notolabrus celidotus]|uniref:TNFAIP3-interacting protein 3-like n=1 Tax=Notolabrus celidotus TaxID=1203425 RepID=UPI00148F5E8D|nr:TNFAIP3-interacting protein 3-like [Notolabrus celidotus]